MKIILTLLLLLWCMLSEAQCNNFSQENCELPFDWPYEFDSQSLSTGILPGQTFRIKAVLYEGKTYYIGICKQEDLHILKFKIIDDDVEYDNTFAKQENDNLSYFELESAETKVIVIELKAARTSREDFNLIDLKCVGVIIGNKDTEE